MKFVRGIAIIISCLLSTLTNAQTDKLQVIVDERMELLTIIQYLSGYPVLTQADIWYKKEVDAYFKDFRDHDAVRLNKVIYRRFFGFDAPPTYVYHFSFPDMKQRAQFSPEDMASYRYNENSDTLTMLMQAFRDLYERSQFHKFYTDHRAFYDSLIAPVRAKIGPTHIIDVLESHYGQKHSGYYVVLSPLMHDGGYGIPVRISGGTVLYALVGPNTDSKDMPEFDVDFLLSDYVIHEFSHSFTNPLITKHLAQLQKDSCLLRPIQKSMKAQGYGSWDACLYEHLVRANEILLNEKVFGKIKADEMYKDMIDNGKWIYLEGLVPIIRQYASNRTKYKTLDAMMPDVIAYFDMKRKACK